MKQTVEQELLGCNISQLKQIAWSVNDEEVKKQIRKIIKIKKEMRFRDFIKDEVQ